MRGDAGFGGGVLREQEITRTDLFPTLKAFVAATGNQKQHHTRTRAGMIELLRLCFVTGSGHRKPACGIGNF